MKRVCITLLVATSTIIFLVAIRDQHTCAFSAESVLQIGSNTLLLQKAETESARNIGLSSRDCLSDNQAMLFVFSYNAQHRFWMKNMRFSIDIVWLDDKKQIVHIEKQVSPDTYPKIFIPTKDARYVLEMTAGRADSLQLSIGQQLSWQ